MQKQKRLAKGLGILRGSGVYLALIALVLAASIAYPQFFTYSNLSNVLRQNSMMGLMAVGMTLVILTGGIDLSVGATAALAAIVAATLAGTSLLLAIFVPVVLGLVVGLANGLVITRLQIVPFIATLATQMAVRGIAYIVTDVQSVAVPDSAVDFIFLGRGYFFGLPVPVVFFLLAAAAFAFVTARTGFGRSIYAIGGNENAARMMGLPVWRNKTLCYVITGGLSALAGVILCARLGAGQPVSGEGWEMDAVASVAIGGTLLSGGVGSVGKTVCGVLIIGLINNVINLQGTINSYWQKIIMGAILLAVIVVQNSMQRKRG